MSEDNKSQMFSPINLSIFQVLFLTSRLLFPDEEPFLLSRYLLAAFFTDIIFYSQEDLIYFSFSHFAWLDTFRFSHVNFIWLL